MTLPRLLALLLLPIAAGCTSAAEPVPADTTPVVAFTNVNVIPMDRERVLADHTVLIRGDRIAAVGPVASVDVPESATVIDGREKYLMPGVAELHAHIPGGQATDALMERVLALFVANGVTTIRGMLGDPRHLTLRDRVARHEVPGPTIYTTGPSFSGTTATSIETAVGMVRDQHAAGYDLLKIHPGVPRDVFDALANEANRLGIPFSGHVPADVGIERALAATFHSIDHIDGYLEYAVSPDAPVDPEDPGFFGANFAAHIDEARLDDIIARTREAGVWIVPTQGLMELFFEPATMEEVRAQPGVRYMPAAMVEGWIRQRAAFNESPELTPEYRQTFLDARRHLLGRMHEAGVDLVMGSDAVQTFSVPGFSLHREMGAMVRSGLTPYEVYVTGTVNVARFFGREAEAGTVEAGKIADLVLVDANPLDDVANFASQTGTMVRGRWHPRAELLAGLTAQ